MRVALVFKVTKSSSYGNPKDGNEMIKELAIHGVASSKNHRPLGKNRFVKRKINSRHKFDVFWDSLFRKYKQEELVEHFASVQLTTYRINKAKRDMRLILILLDHEIEKGIDKTESNHNIKFKYYSKFVNNLFTCFKNMVYLQQRLWRRISLPHILFHGTTTVFLPNIATKGLLPSKAGKCWSEGKYKEPRKVCLTNSLYAAENFALVATNRAGGEAVVLKVNIKELENKMHIIIDTLSNDGLTVFDKHFEFYFMKPVSPDGRIKVYYVLPKPSAFELLNWLSSNLKEDVINSVNI